MISTRKALTVAAGLLLVGVIGCTDPTVAPKSTVTGANIFSDPASYKAFLARIYGGLIVTGQQGPAGNGDIQGIDEGFSQYLRLHWYLNEMPTDEAVIGWNDPGLRVLNSGTWGAGNEMVNAMYYRVYFQVMLANEFLRQTTPAKLNERGHTATALQAEVASYRAEARFLRALSYWHGMDMFGNIPLVTENDPLGSTPPAQATRQAIYDYVVAELTDITADLPAWSPGPSTVYARATQAAAHMLLAKVYLNAGVYTGTPNYAGALTEAAAVIATPNLALATTYRHNFSADNNTSPEIIFAAAQDGANTQTWGGMTFMIHAGCGGSMSAATYGIDYCWGGYRLKPQAYYRYEAADGRRSFFHTAGQDSAVDDIGSFNEGIAAPKFINLTSAGDPATQTTMVDTDFPIFRLADAYLIYAEAHVRGGGGSATTALGYVNALRARAGGIAAWTAAELTTDSILQERGRELLFEGHRRQDLVRYNLFSTGTYLWAWKNNVIGGAALAAGRDLYPIPANELIANPNLTQNPGY